MIELAFLPVVVTTEELCVKESKFINMGTLEMDYTDEYWERRYTVSSIMRSCLQSVLTFKVLLCVACLG